MGPDTMADLCVACFCTACGTCQEAMEIDDATGALLRVNPRKVGSDNGRLRIDASNTILERPEWRVVYTRFIDEVIRDLQCFIFVFSCFDVDTVLPVPDLCLQLSREQQVALVQNNPVGKSQLFNRLVLRAFRLLFVEVR